MRKILLLITVLLLATSCWETQEHDVTPPVIPYYRMSGMVKDIDFKDGLDSIGIRIYALQLVEAPSFEPQYVLSDSGGKFRIDSVFVGSYKLEFYRNDILVNDAGVFQNYGDTTHTFYVPQTYEIQGAQFVSSYDEISFMQNTAFSFLRNNWYLGGFTGYGFYKYKYNYQTFLWEQLNSYTTELTYNVSKDIGLDYGINSNYAYVTVNNDSLYKFDISASYIEHSKVLTLPGLARDVYFINDTVYVAGENSVYVYDEAGFNLQREMLINAEMNDDFLINCIYVKYPYIWVAEENSNLLYQCNFGLKILRTYRPFNGFEPVEIRDMSVDYTGKVWYSR